MVLANPTNKTLVYRIPWLQYIDTQGVWMCTLLQKRTSVALHTVADKDSHVLGSSSFRDKKSEVKRSNVVSKGTGGNRAEKRE